MSETASSNEHERFMAVAIEEARAGAAMGEQPFGAVVAKDGEIIVRSRSLKVSLSDTTAHSETLAISMATRKLGQRRIPGAIFYSTCEPCPMCLGAVLNAGIDTLVLGARNADIRQLATLAFNFKDYTAERFAEMVGWNLDVVEGVLHDECVGLYRCAAVELTR
ncbi:nucleoside deaminase [Kaistia dalseonensis]|uniref:tRNA(Adenine34) deaminase n=1 Tax=Kaistia dalseonensis TaxID=410840 RepID=A0ABU0H9N2_9HYPH|nr:nucleoside deaminase [Kaistia dalseonensis]MCX5496405.1 nucleoside deaminase [Kaistia dalseonensis]MDQ0439026.1 tRNA(adenine34) deaminase [Kaistia dalseonensis]